MDLPEIPILSPLYLSCLLRMSPRVHTRLIILYSLSLLNYSFDCSPSSSRGKGSFSPSFMARVTFLVCGVGWAWVGGNCGKRVLYPGPQVHLVLLWSDLWSNKVMSCWMWTWHHMSLMRLFLLCYYCDWCPGQLVGVENLWDISGSREGRKSHRSQVTQAHVKEGGATSRQTRI